MSIPVPQPYDPVRAQAQTGEVVNISTARHTWSTVEAQGFVPYSGGQFFAIPALRRGKPGERDDRPSNTSTARLSVDHRSEG
jgi:hypothetical protein